MNRLTLRSRDRVGMTTAFALVALLPLALAPLGRARARTAAHRDAEQRTASVGMATLVPGATLATLVERADQALYRAKPNGRDCLELVPAAV